MFKKGQAAMEFLMTYGWAILAAIIAIGVLAYFGVFSPGRLVGNQGIINSPFNLDAFRISATADTIIMEVTQNLGSSMNTLGGGGNGGGFDFDLTSPASEQCTTTVTTGTNVLVDTTPADGIGDNAWPSGTKVTFTADCATNWNEGDQARGNVAINYRPAGSSLTQQSTGNVRGTSQV